MDLLKTVMMKGKSSKNKNLFHQIFSWKALCISQSHCGSLIQNPVYFLHQISLQKTISVGKDTAMNGTVYPAQMLII
jgi:hypothetical protein